MANLFSRLHHSYHPHSTSASASPGPQAQLPIKVKSDQLLGDIRSKTTHCIRDNGFHGKIGDCVIITYGDTMFRDRSYDDKFRGMTSDSCALATSNPLQVEDVLLDSQGWPQQFCPLNPAWGENPSQDAMGITNVIETNPGEGIIFFLKNHRPGGKDTLIGAGVATITMHDRKPIAKRLAEYWWDGKFEPHYGDVCAIRVGNHIYAYGHGNDSQTFVYVCRVQYNLATDLSAYEYWNGKSWQKERLYNVSEKESIWWQVQQGQVVYSNYYGCLIFVYCNRFMDNQVLACTSNLPTGPWSKPVTLHKAQPISKGGCIYGAVPHPYYDESGKTLICTFTNHPNRLQAIKVTFE